MSQGEGSIEKVLPEGLTEEHLTTLHLPSTEVTQLQRMKLHKPQQQRGKYTDPTPTPIPRDEHANMDQEESGKEEDSPGYATPPEAMAKTTQQLHTALSNQLDKALQEALDKPGPSCPSKEEEIGKTHTRPPRLSNKGKLNLATEKWFLEPNKVRFLDEPDTYRANVGKAQGNPAQADESQNIPSFGYLQTHQHHLTGKSAKAPGKEELPATLQERHLMQPLTPLPSKRNQVWRCMKHHQSPGT